MGINSTEVSYGFGQLGSVFSDNTTTAMVAPTGKVFVAIHFLEDTTLATSGGLVAQNDTDAGIEYASTGTAAHDTVFSPDLGQSGSGGTIIDVSNTIPAGTIIYGRYTQVKASSNKMIIAYIGN